jgi:hypothetical protein
MLKIFQNFKGSRIEIFQINGVFTVLELGKYEISYQFDKLLNRDVFIEDIPVQPNRITISTNEIILEEARYFENYFGYASLTINNHSFLINIRIEKLKLSEIEDIFLYLWKKEDRLFNVFFSKSTYNLDFKKNGSNLGQTSKIIAFLDLFLSDFEKLTYSFSNLPHTILREINKIMPYDSKSITFESVNWILSNLDEIHFEDSFKGHYNAIELKSKYGLIENIKTAENLNSYNNYENQIILGSFSIILKKLKKLKKEITSMIDINLSNNDQFADFKDLKRIPFIKLFEDSQSLEKRTQKLFEKYKKIFNDSTIITQKPVLTSVFSKKLHYKKAYRLIKNLHEYKFNLFGEFKLLNISRLSQLYEVYNLYIILESLKEKLKLDFFYLNAFSNRNDEIIEKITFINDEYSIVLLYEHKYFSTQINPQETLLRRIDTTKSNFYSPDYIIEIKNRKTHLNKYYILDSKYSNQYVVKNIHLPDLIEKYIINSGIYGKWDSKIASLTLIFPGEETHKIIDSDLFEPKITLIGCKPNFEINLKKFISDILENNIPEEMLTKINS